MRRTGDGVRSSDESVSAGLATIGGAGVVRMDCCGMRCPQPVLRLAVETAEAPAGTIVEIVGDCPTFEKDVRVFCDRRNKKVLSIRREGGRTSITILY